MKVECFFRDRVINIADYYTVIDGKQIAKEGEIELLRERGRKGLLVCTCPCKGKLKVVFGKNMKRRPHFRFQNGEGVNCKAREESPITFNAKMVIKCWLKDVFELKDGEIRYNKAMNEIYDNEHRYEYTHYLPEQKLGIYYERIESNLNDAKLEAIFAQKEVDSLCITDIRNDGCEGQYPEFGIKVQKVQGFYALLNIEEMTPYEEAILKVVRYEKTYRGTWAQIDVCEDKLSKYGFDENNQLVLDGRNVQDRAMERGSQYVADQKKQQRLEQERQVKVRQLEEEKRLEAERLLREKELVKKKEEEERNSYWENEKREKEYREAIAKMNAQQEVESLPKQPTPEEVLKQNPKITVLMSYISGLNTLGGKFTYESKHDGSVSSKYETIHIREVCFNHSRMRIEIKSHDNKRYIIFLQLERENVYTRYTWDGYTIFSLYEHDENNVVLQFRHLMECDGEKQIGMYRCNLVFPCEYKDDESSACMYISQENKCSFREWIY